MVCHLILNSSEVLADLSDYERLDGRQIYPGMHRGSAWVCVLATGPGPNRVEACQIWAQPVTNCRRKWSCFESQPVLERRLWSDFPADIRLPGILWSAWNCRFAW